MKKLSILILLYVFFSGCLYTLSKTDIETPHDTIKTLQWVLQKIKNDDFLLYFEELFTGKGEEIAEKVKDLKESKEAEDKKRWLKLQEIFEKILIKLDRMKVNKGYAVAHCRYYIPQNYYIQKVIIEMEKNSDGWQIVKITPEKKWSESKGKNHNQLFKKPKAD